MEEEIPPCVEADDDNNNNCKPADPPPPPQGWGQWMLAGFRTPSTSRSSSMQVPSGTLHAASMTNGHAPEQQRMTTGETLSQAAAELDKGEVKIADVVTPSSEVPIPATTASAPSRMLSSLSYVAFMPFNLALMSGGYLLSNLPFSRVGEVPDMTAHQNIVADFAAKITRPELADELKQIEEFIATFDTTQSLNERAQTVHRFLEGLAERLDTHALWSTVPSWERRLRVLEGAEDFVWSRGLTHMLLSVDGDVLARDVAFVAKLNQLDFLRPRHLDAPDIDLENSMHWDAIHDELWQINSVQTPALKLDCVLKCTERVYKLLESQLEKPSELSADQIVPTLVYCILKAKPACALSNLNYMIAYPHEGLIHPGGMAQYCITQYQGVIDWLEKANASSFNIDPSDYALGLADPEAFRRKEQQAEMQRREKEKAKLEATVIPPAEAGVVEEPLSESEDECDALDAWVYLKKAGPTIQVSQKRLLQDQIRRTVGTQTALSAFGRRTESHVEIGSELTKEKEQEVDEPIKGPTIVKEETKCKEEEPAESVHEDETEGAANVNIVKACDVERQANATQTVQDETEKEHQTATSGDVAEIRGSSTGVEATHQS